MQTKPRTLNKQALEQLLRDVYNLSIVDLTFLPQGKEAYNYIATSSAQRRYVVKVFDTLRPANLEQRLRVVHHLATHCGIRTVVAPHPTSRGIFLAPFGTYAVTIFDYLEQATSLAARPTTAHWQQIGYTIARLHQAMDCPALPPPPYESFTISFKSWLLQVLNAAKQPAKEADQRIEEARRVLQQETPEILATLQRLEQQGRQVAASGYTAVLSHGDLNEGNMLLSDSGQCYLIDWSQLMAAPLERDLVSLNWAVLEATIEHYLQAGPKAPGIRLELLEYYCYRALLASITDNGSWLLLEDPAEEEAQAAWSELQDRLPILHKQVRAKAALINELIKSQKGSSNF